ncbi:glycosidase [Chloroflexota bacterium]
MTKRSKSTNRKTQEIDRTEYSREVNESFKLSIQEPVKQTGNIGKADIVIGIPFYNEADTIGEVIETVYKGLEEYYPDKKCVIVAAGSPAGVKALNVINAIPESGKVNRIAFILNDKRLNGKGWSVRAIFELARVLNADLAIIEADVRSRQKDGHIEGIAQDWIGLLMEPVIKGEADLVVSRFNRHYLESVVSTQLVYPLLAAIFNCPIHDPEGGQWGISNRLLRNCMQDMRQWAGSDIGGYGIDSWFTTVAITSGVKICEANLGVKLDGLSVSKAEVVVRQVAEVLFEQIVATKGWWREIGRIGESALLNPLATYGVKKPHQPDEVIMIPRQLVIKYKRGFNKFHSLYRSVLPEEAYRQLEELARNGIRQFHFPGKLWAQIVYCFLLDIGFRKEFAKGDLMNSFIPLCEGHVASFSMNLQSLKDRLSSDLPGEVEHLVSLEAVRQTEELVDEFLRQKAHFLAMWESKEEAHEPPIPKVTYREFVPGVPLVVPLEVTNKSGRVVATANGIYDNVFDRYKREFDSFIYEQLQVPRDATSLEIGERIREFMLEVERQVDKALTPGDLSTVEGTLAVADAIFHNFPRQDTFALTPEAATWLLRRHPPTNLITKLDYSHLESMLEDHNANDILALASWSEERDYAEQIWALIKENDRPEHFQSCSLRLLVTSHEEFPSMVEMEEAGALCKINGRVVVSNLYKGMGGEYPKMRYLTTIAKNIVEVERFGQVWKTFAEERKDFGEKVINSLRGHWGRDPLSAHSIFESGHQQVLIERMREMVGRIHQEEIEGTTELITLLNQVIDSYHLFLTLSDGTFVPCSAWTWASYSFKGGKGLPTPLSLHVERDWSSREYLTEYYEATGGNEEEIEEKITRLMGEGREWVDMVPILLGSVQEAGSIIPAQTTILEHPPVGVLTRFGTGLMLEPVKENSWESTCVLNAGAINLNGKVYLVYRAVGEDGISRLGMAVSEDGLKVTERLDEPIFYPKNKSEIKGCEDPRLTLMGERIYMVYTAYDGIVAQIALASITINDFTDYNWSGWRRHGLVFPGFVDKDGALFPEKFDDKYAILHRVDPHIWITFSSHLRCPWSRKEHKILAGSTSGMMWDGDKIGAGAQPIKTKYGWLLITHGVDESHIYRLGVMVLDLADPKILLYRSPNPILEPRESFEIGEPGKCWVPNVVFSCGAVPREGSKEILDAEDEVIVYYGAADTVLGVAIARVSDLIPVEVRYRATNWKNY